MNAILLLIVIGTALAITLLSVAKWADEHKTLPADAPEPDLPAVYPAATEISEDRA